MDNQVDESVDYIDSTEDEICVKHLEFIETTINRMSKNSFQAKAWCITIIAALIAIYLTLIEDRVVSLVVGIFSILVIILFYIIDAYYLYLERGYRYLYKVVAKLDLVEDTKPCIIKRAFHRIFSRKSKKGQEKKNQKNREEGTEPIRIAKYDMEIPDVKRGWICYFDAMFCSKSTAVFYIVLILLQVGLILFSWFY